MSILHKEMEGVRVLEYLPTISCRRVNQVESIGGRHGKIEYLLLHGITYESQIHVSEYYHIIEEWIDLPMPSHALSEESSVCDNFESTIFSYVEYSICSWESIFFSIHYAIYISTGSRKNDVRMTRIENSKSRHSWNGKVRSDSICSEYTDMDTVAFECLNEEHIISECQQLYGFVLREFLFEESDFFFRRTIQRIILVKLRGASEWYEYDAQLTPLS